MTVLDVPGVANFRDVGGIAVGNSRVRDGVLFRSGQLAGLTDAGSEFLHSSVHHIVDLRDDMEVSSEPSAIRDIPTTRLPLFVGSVASFFTETAGLTEMYRHLVDQAGPKLVDAMRIIGSSPSTLVHCTVGKDRTGVTVALALSAVGADRDAVIDDYALTASLLPEERNQQVLAYMRSRNLDTPNAIELATASPAPVMRALLAAIDAEFGSAIGYLRAQGLSDAELEALGETLVV